MKWRTDVPSAKLIVAFVYGEHMILQYEEYDNAQYSGYYNRSSKIDINDIEKWADLEEDETVTENNSLKEEVISYFQGYWPGTETAEQCNTDMHFTPLAIMRLAEHFAKWGAEHTIKELEPKIKLVYGKVSMNPFDCSEAFEELLNKVGYETH